MADLRRGAESPDLAEERGEMVSIVRRVVDTDDLDEAVEIFTAAFSGGGLRLSEPGDDFRYVQRFAGTSAIGVVQQSIGARLESRSEESDTLFVAWTDRGNASYRMGRQELAADAGLLWSGRRPVQASVLHADIGSVLLDRGQFEGRARMLLGRADFALPDIVALPTRNHVALMRTQLAVLRRAQLREEVMSNPLLERTVVDHTIAVVLTATALDGTAGEVARVPAAVRRAVAFIDDNLDRPISVADLAAASGLSARSLQAAFRRDLGESPLQRIRRGRLARVRVELQAADASVVTVAAVARRWGFGHLGRFAQDYRAAFGELPSVTLRN